MNDILANMIHNTIIYVLVGLFTGVAVAVAAITPITIFEVLATMAIFYINFQVYKWSDSRGRG